LTNLARYRVDANRLPGGALSHARSRHRQFVEVISNLPAVWRE
jgi:hypothetical protein